jgi:hypothetical protein
MLPLHKGGVSMSITKDELIYAVCPKCYEPLVATVLHSCSIYYHHCNQCGTNFDGMGNRLSLCDIDELSKEFSLIKSTEIKNPHLV